MRACARPRSRFHALLLEVRRGHWIHQSWSYRWAARSRCREPNSSAPHAVYAPKCWAGPVSTASCCPVWQEACSCAWVLISFLPSGGPRLICCFKTLVPSSPFASHCFYPGGQLAAWFNASQKKKKKIPLLKDVSELWQLWGLILQIFVF